MRLEAQAKLGYYPVNLKTIEFVCGALTLADPNKTYMLDPCCGAGIALHHLGLTSVVTERNLYGVELDTGRYEQARTIMPDATLVNGSFMNTWVVPVGSFSLAWVNPPYENELKQHDRKEVKLEHSFMREVTRYLQNDGVMILHMPIDRMDDGLRYDFTNLYHDATLVTLPEGCSPYREGILVGRKRAKAATYWDGSQVAQSKVMPRFTVPAGEKIRKFVKYIPSDIDIAEAMDNASWRKVFFHKAEREPLRPVLPLGAGHLGLTLASGLLDGYLEPEGWEPHVVRGIATKENVLVKTEEEESDTGKVTTTETFRENFKLKVRAITGDGTIHEFS